MSWNWIKRKLAGEPAPGESDGGGQAEAPGAGDRQHEESSASLLAEGWARDARGDLNGANEAFSRSSERGSNASAYYGRGVVRCKLRSYRAAVADLSRALKVRPRFAAALTERGLAYAESGEVEKAIQDYDAAIAIDPSYGWAHENKGAGLSDAQAMGGGHPAPGHRPPACSVARCGPLQPRASPRDAR